MAFDLADTVAVLERTPTTLAALLNNLPDRWLSANEGEGTWCPYDVVGHLIHGERTDWMPRLRHIMAGKKEPFESFNRTAQFTESQSQSLAQLLQTFSELRAQNLTELRELDLTEDDLSRPGTHPELGDVILSQLLATWVVHDLDHIAQIARTMAKVYSDDVGSWSAYLSILHDRRPPD